MPTIDSNFATYIWIVGASGVLSALAAAASIVATFRRQPPLEREMYQSFLRREELAKHAEEDAKAVSEVHITLARHIEENERWADDFRRQFWAEINKLDRRHQETAGKLFDLMRDEAKERNTSMTNVQSSLTAISGTVLEIRGQLQTHIQEEKG